MNRTNRYLGYSLLISSCLLVFSGCGGSSVVFTPDFSNPILQQPHLKRDSVQIVKVLDGRSDTTSRIGTARVGMLNREVPYLMNGKVTEVVRTMLDSIIVTGPKNDRFLPVIVSVDMLEVGENMKLFGEEGYFACNLRFTYPVTADSAAYEVVFVKETDQSAVDITDAIEPLIYKGIVQCAQKFVTGTLDKMSQSYLTSADTAAAFIDQRSLAVSGTTPSLRSDAMRESAMSADSSKYNELLFQYVQGSIIKTGIRLSYHMMTKSTDPQFRWGLGIGFTYYDIDNSKDFYTGSFASFGARLVAKYMFSDSPTSAYLAGRLALAGGSERITQGYGEQSNFFFGPTAEEVIGITIAERISLEFGSFQLAHFGSKLLPSDVGFVVGFSIGM